MPKTVIISGLYAPYEEDTGGAEIWGCNRSYIFEERQRLARLYWIDALSDYARQFPTWVEDNNRLGIPIICQRHYPEIPLSRPFPLEQAVERFGIFFRDENGDGKGEPCFGSTIAYMICHAILDGVEELTMHRILVGAKSVEYFPQKHNLDTWLVIARAHGISLNISADSQLLRPHLWEPSLYGYVKQDNYPQCNAILASAVKSLLAMPIVFRMSEPPLQAA